MAYRSFIKAAFFGTFVFAGAALAAPTDSVVCQLQDLGYTNIKISRTMLGRARIVDETCRHRCEIVIIPSTGEILRDVVDNGGGAVQARLRATSTQTSGSGGGNENGNGGGFGS